MENSTVAGTKSSNSGHEKVIVKGPVWASVGTRTEPSQNGRQGSAHWPNVENSPHADKLNNARKYVVTTTLSQLDWQHSTPISGDVAAEVAALKEQDGPLLQVHGSSGLIQTLLSHDLVDELRLWTFPE